MIFSLSSSLIVVAADHIVLGGMIKVPFDHIIDMSPTRNGRTRLAIKLKPWSVATTR